MPEEHQFEHLPLVLKHHGPARFPSGGSDADLTKEFRQNRHGHSTALLSSLTMASNAWKERQQARRDQGAPELDAGIALVLQVDTSLDLDDLRRQFEFEIVAEEEEGYVIVASEDIDLTLFPGQPDLKRLGVREKLKALSDHPDTPDEERAAAEEALRRQARTLN